MELNVQNDQVLNDNFNTSVNIVNNLKQMPSNEDLLQIYGLFKQANVGDVNTDRPGMLDFKGKSKWDAWNSFKGTPQSDAKQLYINKSMELFKKFGQ